MAAIGSAAPLQRFPSTELEIVALDTPDLLYIVLSFMDVNDIFSNTRFVNVLWNSISMNATFWQRFCNTLWKGKFFITSYALNYVKNGNKESIELKHIPKFLIDNETNWNIDIPNDPIFDDSKNESVNDKNDKNDKIMKKNNEKANANDAMASKRVESSFEYSPFYSYFISLLDYKRNYISFEELTSIQWNFVFKPKMSVYSLSDDDDHIIIGQFKKDYTLVQTPQFHEPFSWRFLTHNGKNDIADADSDLQASNGKNEWGIIDYLHLFDNNVYSKLFQTNNDTAKNTGCNDSDYDSYDSYDCDDSGSDNNDNNDSLEKINVSKSKHPNCGLNNEQLRKIRRLKREDGKLMHGRWIQVNEFPPLCVFRSKNWGFVLENQWVRFTSY